MKPYAILAALSLLPAAAAAQSRSVESVVSAAAARHHEQLRGGSAFQASGKVLGFGFTLHARPDAGGWTVTGARPGEPTPTGEMSAGLDQMTLNALAMLLAADPLLDEPSAFRLSGVDSVQGRPVDVLTLEAASEAGVAFHPGRGGQIHEMRLLIDQATHTVSAISMTARLRDAAGEREVDLLAEYSDYGRRGPVILPGRVRFSVTGVMPPMEDKQREQMAAQVVAARTRAASLPAAEREQAEQYLEMAERAVRENRLVMTATLTSVTAEP